MCKGSCTYLEKLRIFLPPMVTQGLFILDPVQISSHLRAHLSKWTSITNYQFSHPLHSARLCLDCIFPVSASAFSPIHMWLGFRQSRRLAVCQYCSHTHSFSLSGSEIFIEFSFIIMRDSFSTSKMPFRCKHIQSKQLKLLIYCLLNTSALLSGSLLLW